MGILGGEPDQQHIQYGLGKSAMILKVTRRKMMSWRNQKYNLLSLLYPTYLILNDFNVNTFNI